MDRGKISSFFSLTIWPFHPFSIRFDPPHNSISRIDPIGNKYKVQISYLYRLGLIFSFGVPHLHLYICIYKNKLRHIYHLLDDQNTDKYIAFHFYHEDNEVLRVFFQIQINWKTRKWKDRRIWSPEPTQHVTFEIWNAFLSSCFQWLIIFIVKIAMFCEYSFKCKPTGEPKSEKK